VCSGFSLFHLLTIVLAVPPLSFFPGVACPFGLYYSLLSLYPGYSFTIAGGLGGENRYSREGASL
jgi:hypothetical protein